MYCKADPCLFCQALGRHSKGQRCWGKCTIKRGIPSSVQLFSIVEVPKSLNEALKAKSAISAVIITWLWEWSTPLWKAFNFLLWQLMAPRPAHCQY